jgi:hypothetical protein
MSPIKILRPLTPQNAVLGLEKIFEDLQIRFHDQWDWMEAYFYLGAIEAALDLPIRDRAVVQQSRDGDTE